MYTRRGRARSASHGNSSAVRCRTPPIATGSRRARSRATGGCARNVPPRTRSSIPMTSPCPSCGVEMEFSERAVVLRTGSCPSCGKEFAFVEGATLAGHLPRIEEMVPATAVGAPAVVAEGAPECEECGAPLEFRAGRHGEILAICEDCETTRVLRPEGTPGEERPRRPAGRPRESDSREGPRARPCRRCGAPLRFSTQDDGQVVGECDSCGNRFTLPPRSEGGRREFRRGSGPRPYYRSSGPRRFGGSRPATPYRSSGDRDRRRRRRRDDDE
jgi:ssDNA-binding Zn-finger/Zn-ribbon topoisomerase 1/predicted RNA-binding Zn-ribbon protein involved in translation (DUF1610 family)